jgi:hypothetical protein
MHGVVPTRPYILRVCGLGLAQAAGNVIGHFWAIKC